MVSNFFGCNKCSCKFDSDRYNSHRNISVRLQAIWALQWKKICLDIYISPIIYFNILSKYIFGCSICCSYHKR